MKTLLGGKNTNMEGIYVVKSNNVGICKPHIIVEHMLWTSDKGRVLVIVNTTISAQLFIAYYLS